MKKKIYIFLKYFATFLLMLMIFNLCLYVVCLIPSSKVEENIKESSYILKKQGASFQLSKIFNVVNNNRTDSVILNESYSIDNEHPYISYMKARKDYKKGLTIKEIEDINGEGVTINYIDGKEVIGMNYDYVGELGDLIDGKLKTSLNYGKYWHGYLVLYRPLLVLLNITQIRTLMLIIFIGLYTYFIYLLNKRFGKNIAWIFGISLICTGFFSASFSLESSPIFLTMMISAIILLKRIDKIKDFSLYIFVVACIANFVDYLTVPLITLGVLCSIYLLKIMEDGKDWKYCTKFLISNTLVWIAGYACTWLSKWILYDLSINKTESMIKVGFTQAFYRMTRNNEHTPREVSYINTIIKILSNSSLYIVLSLWVLMGINKFKITIKKFNPQVVPFLLVSLLPIGWYFTLANHTMMHAYFTYRHVLVFMLGILLAFNQLFFGKEKKDF